MTDFDELGSALSRLGCALAAGGVLGWERQWREKPAGLRTNMIVALGAAVLMFLTERLALSMTGVDGKSIVDPSRVIQGIVGGIGFVGAGAILQSRHSVKGLTTASTLWLSAALGVCSGLGYYILTLTAVTLALIVLIVFGNLEQAAFGSSPSKNPDNDSG